METVGRERRLLEDICEKLLARLKAREPEIEELGWKIIARDFEQGINFILNKEDHYLAITFEEMINRAESAPRFNMLVSDPLNIHRNPTREEMVIAEIFRKFVEKGFSIIFETQRPAISRKLFKREITVDRILIREAKTQYYINPYVGCTIGCQFCMAQDMADLSRRIEGLPKTSWGRFLDVKINAAEALEAEASQAEPGPVRMSPLITDPYQPCESRYRITRGCLQVLLKYGFTPLILTRARRILDDLELLKSFDSAFVGFSIPTDNDKMRRIFEPGADPIEDRLDALEKCCAAGLNTFVFVQPILPMNVKKLLDAVSPLIRFARVDRMNNIEKMADVYREHGLESAATDSYFIKMQRKIENEFAKRGIPTFEMDDYDEFFLAAKKPKK